MARKQQPRRSSSGSRRKAPAPPKDEALEFAIAAARIAAENKTEDVQVLNLRGLSNFAEFFVLGTGTSPRQMHAVVDLIEEYARSIGREPFRVADSREAHWILTDYVDVVIHLFDPEHREYYDLDNLWGDAPRVPWQDEQQGKRIGRKS
jgi:ribosome-associated protein